MYVQICETLHDIRVDFKFIGNYLLYLRRLEQK